jgi:hypothetical protein
LSSFIPEKVEKSLGLIEKEKGSPSPKKIFSRNGDKKKKKLTLLQSEVTK